MIQDLFTNLESQTNTGEIKVSRTMMKRGPSQLPVCRGGVVTITNWIDINLSLRPAPFDIRWQSITSGACIHAQNPLHSRLVKPTNLPFSSHSVWLAADKLYLTSWWLRGRRFSIVLLYLPQPLIPVTEWRTTTKSDFLFTSNAHAGCNKLNVIESTMGPPRPWH